MSMTERMTPDEAARYWHAESARFAVLLGRVDEVRKRMENADSDAYPGAWRDIQIFGAELARIMNGAFRDD